MYTHITFDTKDTSLALYFAWDEFRTRFGSTPACVILSEQTWLQATLSRDLVSGAPDSFRGVPIVVSKATPAPIEMVGEPGTLHSLMLKWAVDEKG